MIEDERASSSMIAARAVQQRDEADDHREVAATARQRPPVLAAYRGYVR
jgi:hypothetical protein